MNTSSKIVFLPILLILLMLLTLCDVDNVHSNTTGVTNDWSDLKINVNDNLSISLALPSNWKIEKNSLHDNIENAITINPSSNLPSFLHPDRLTVGIEQFESEIESSEFSKSAKEILSSRLIDFELIDSFQVNVTDLMGERILFNHKVNGKTIKVLQSWIIDNKTAIIVTFATEPHRFGYYNPLVNKIISSLDIAKGQKEERSNKLLPSSSNYSRYTSQFGFEISYPKDWTLNEGINRVSFISKQTDSLDMYLERLDIYYNISDSNSSNNNNNLSSSYSVKEKENMNIELLDELEYLSNNMQDLNIISINDFHTSNAEGKKLVYTYSSNVVQTKVYEFLLKKNSTFVIITFSTNTLDSDGNEFSSTIESIIESFRFTIQ
jgi:hypothetical protein